MTETSIGMMDSAYFVPRQQILKWMNTILGLNIQHIEDLGQGSVYCHLLDASFGNRNPVSMTKINWKAKFEYDCAVNLKHFQLGLDKIGSMKKIDIERLAKCKYQDNLEVIQWLKRYIEIHGNVSSDYNGPQRRNFANFESVVESKKNPCLRKDGNAASQKRFSHRHYASTLSQLSSANKKAEKSCEKENQLNTSAQIKKENPTFKSSSKKITSNISYGMSAKTVGDFEALSKIKDIIVSEPYVKAEEKLKMISTIIMQHPTLSLKENQTSNFQMENEDEQVIL